MKYFAIQKRTNNFEGILESGIASSGDVLTIESQYSGILTDTINGTATADGTSTTLTQTDVQNLSPAPQKFDHIYNITKDAHAVVRSVTTDTITTTPLVNASGSEVSWDNSDEWTVGAIELQVSKRSSDGKTINEYENILFTEVSGTTLRTKAKYRGYGGTQRSFDAADYIACFDTEKFSENINNYLGWLSEKVSNLQDQDVTLKGEKTFQTHPQLPVAAPTGNQPVTKNHLDSVLGNMGDSIDFTFGEAITGKGTPFYIAQGFTLLEESTEEIAESGLNSFDALGAASNYTHIAQKLDRTTGFNKINNVKVKLKDGSGNPTMTVRFELRDSPSGSVLKTSSTVLAASAITSSFQEFEIPFDDFDTSAMTDVYFVMVSLVNGNPGYQSWSQNYGFEYGTSGYPEKLYYGDGSSYTLNGSAAAVHLKADWKKETLNADGVAGKAYKADSLYSYKTKFDGFLAVDSVSADATAKGQFKGISESGMFSGLEEGKNYFLQDGGGVGLQSGTNELQVGEAFSSTTMRIAQNETAVAAENNYVIPKVYQFNVPVGTGVKTFDLSSVGLSLVQEDLKNILCWVSGTLGSDAQVYNFGLQYGHSSYWGSANATTEEQYVRNDWSAANPSQAYLANFQASSAKIYFPNGSYPANAKFNLMVIK